MYSSREYNPVVQDVTHRSRQTDPGSCIEDMENPSRIQNGEGDSPYGHARCIHYTHTRRPSGIPGRHAVPKDTSACWQLIAAMISWGDTARTAGFAGSHYR